MTTTTRKKYLAMLDLNDPTDRELEAKLDQKLRHHEHDRDPSLYNLYVDIYKYFFDVVVSDDDDEDPSIVEGFTQQQQTPPPAQDQTPTTALAVVTPPANNVPSVQDLSLNATTVFQYAKGNLNPLLKETIRRIVSIDSQFRDKKCHPYSTAFTINLSEILRDVVSMKLYSIQLPYTWYTISRTFGSNFFYWKGNSPGIDNGNFDYLVSIPYGNYQATSFQDALNTAIQTQVVQTHPDVLFGTTAATYNTVNSRMSLTTDIRNIYNEHNYALIFPYFPADPMDQVTSIPHLLGYVYTAYQPGTVHSLPGVADPANPANATPTFVVDPSNNLQTVYVMVYQGPQAYDPARYSPFPGDTASYAASIPDASYVFQAIPISLTTTATGTPQSLAAILQDLNTQLASNAYLNPPTSTHVSAVTYDASSHTYQFAIYLNRINITNGPYVKSALFFPPEPSRTDASGTPIPPLWVGPNSGFQFPARVMALDAIVSETASKTTTYTFGTTSPTVLYQCVAPYYSTDPSNNATLTVPVAPADTTTPLTSYTLAEYVAAIQQGGATLSATTRGAFQTTLALDASTGNVPTLGTQIQRVFDTTQFELDLSGSILDLLCHFPKTLSATTPGPTSYTATFPIQDGYVMYDASLNPGRYPNNEIIVRSVGPHNAAVPPRHFYLPCPPHNVFPTADDFIRALNAFFAATATAPVFGPDRITLAHCRASPPNFLATSTRVTLVLTVDIRATLTADDYAVVLNDPSTDSWTNYLFFSATGTPSGTPLADVSGATLVATQPVYGNLLTLTPENNFLYLTPVPNTLGGVYTGVGDTTYRIPLILDLPLDVAYTKEQIVASLNRVLAANTTTTQSSSVSIDPTTSYTTFSITVNKVFTAQDYRLVFFDTTSFTRCHFGLPITVTSDTTLGWILGFRNATEYPLGNAYMTADTTQPLAQLQNTYYDSFLNQPYTYNPATNVAVLTGDTSINVNIYNYALLILDDYTLNHLNDGLVTVTSTDTDIPLPSYATYNAQLCNPALQTVGIGNIVTDTPSNTQLTANQIFAANVLKQNQQNKTTTTTQGPFVQDMFALIPIRSSGLQNGQSYVEFGGTLQNQDRLYFGPVNLRRMTIQLLNDKGTLLDLNGADWSFSLLVEQMYGGVGS